ncbi:hypothetical protein RQP46_006074 [Phenoliferia psychrophenolica]
MVRDFEQADLDVVVELSEYFYGRPPGNTMILTAGPPVTLTLRPFEPWWREAPVAVREVALLKGLHYACLAFPPETRCYLPEFNILSSFAKSPQTFITLVTFFARPEYRRARPTTYPRCGFDIN